MKYAKALVGPHPQFDRVVGQTFEIVPLADPAGASQELRVRVLYRGEPPPGAEVKQRSDDGQAHEREIVKTDADGIAVVRPGAGRQLVSVSYTVPSSQPTLADVDAHTATLTFDGNPALRSRSATADQFAFASHWDTADTFEERLRFEVDRSWRGELPFTALWRRSAPWLFDLEQARPAPEDVSFFCVTLVLFS